MTALLEARAFAIWRYAHPREWDCSYEEIADATGLDYKQVNTVITVKGWGGRIGRGRREDRGSSLRMWHLDRGHDVDLSKVDLTQLIR